MTANEIRSEYYKTPQYKYYMQYKTWVKVYPCTPHGRYNIFGEVSDIPANAVVFEGLRCIPVWELTEKACKGDFV